jgi:hypothetical protein
VMSGRHADTPKTNIVPLLRLYNKSPGLVLGFSEEQMYSQAYRACWTRTTRNGGSICSKQSPASIMVAIHT